MKKSICLLAVALASLLPAGGAAQNPKTDEPMKTNRKVLVAFFSHTGENYAVGHIEKGNTHIVAEMIADKTGGTLFEIVPAKEYPQGYNACIEVARTEKEAGARPALTGDIAAEDYDVIFLGYPNWWGDLPMAVYTFLEKHDWSGKTILPFCTHEGSGLSATERYIAGACAGATVGKGLALRGATAQNRRAEAQASVEAWLKKSAF